jgi:multidrug efflux pump subunit AcrB
MYRRFAGPVLKSKRNSWVFLISVFVGTVAVSVLFATKDVTVKLLPFDNKSEIQVVMDLPEGASLEATERNLAMVAHALGDLPELSHIQSYAGTAAPFNFNGLVRHYDIRRKPWQGDLQINLTPKHERDRQSHEIALQIRKRIEAMEFPAGTTVKVVEVPPGPPVISTLMAEIYGPDQKTRRQLAWKVREAFENVDYIVDIDDSIGLTPERLRFEVDQGNLEFHGVHEQELFDTLKVLLNGTSIGYSHRGDGTNPVEIAIRLPKKSLFLGEHLLATPVEAPGEAADKGAVVEIGDIVRLKRELASYPIFRHNGRFAEVVYGELAGRFEAPIYGMFDVNDELAKMNWGAEGAPTIAYHGQPTDLKQATVLWDGEWEVTYVTFRDMGLAFAFALIAVYILIVGQFSNFRVPLVIMTPIPLSLIGIVIGHLIFDAPFTATSMIGFIALAGILVRNSILLVDFIRHRMAEGEALRDALLQAGAIRLRPILLTAVAAMIGAAFILTDPIFQGLAISMVFGLASSTALTLLVIPAVYVVLRDDGHPAKTPAGMK